MAWNRPRLPVVAFETRGNISWSEPGRIEPVFERRCRAVVAEGSAIPNSLEGGNLIESGALVGFERISWIHAYADGDDIDRACGRFETIGSDQLVVGVERWCVAVSALLRDRLDVS